MVVTFDLLHILALVERCLQLFDPLFLWKTHKVNLTRLVRFRVTLCVTFSSLDEASDSSTVFIFNISASEMDRGNFEVASNS